MILAWASFFSLTGFIFHGVSAHYVYRTLLTSSGSSEAAVRIPAENSPIHDITSSGATCNVGLSPATETVSVAAGSLIGFKIGAGTTVFHRGPASLYLGMAPGRAADWDGSGQNWFKVIAEWGATFHPFTFSALGKDTFTSTIPSSIPSGEYLVRMEHIALHLTGSPEVFVSCAQIKITGGGSGNPSKVSIPGHIAPDDPMVMLNIYWPVPTAYTVPGPAVYSDQSPASPNSYVDPPKSATVHISSQPSPVPSPPAFAGNQTLPSKPISCRHRRQQRRNKSPLPIRHIRRRSH